MQYTCEQTYAIEVLNDLVGQLQGNQSISGEDWAHAKVAVEILKGVQIPYGVYPEDRDPPYQVYRVPVFVECYGRDADEARTTVEEALCVIDSWNELLDQDRIDAIDPEIGPILTVSLGNIEEVHAEGSSEQDHLRSIEASIKAFGIAKCREVLIENLY